MRIPSRFKLFGQTIEVVHDPAYFMEHEHGCGFASYKTNQIILRGSTETWPMTPENEESVFWHEVVHFLLYFSEAGFKGNEDYMHQEEGFVDLLSALMHQAITSFEYDEDVKMLLMEG